MNKSMDHYIQHDKKIDKNTNIRKFEKGVSTNKQEKEEKIRCGLSLYSFEYECEWYIDSGCSHHMAGDKSKMESLRKNHHGNVILGTDVSTKVLGHGRAKINKNRVAVDSLLVQGLKNNILSVGQMVVNGNINVFIATKCKVMNEVTGKVIIRGYRNQDKLYVFKDRNSHRYEKGSDLT